MYYIVSIIVFYVSYRFFKKVAGGDLSFQRMNIYSFIFWIQLVILSLVGVNIIVNEWFPFFHYSERVKNLGYFSVCYSMLVIPLVMLYISKLFNFNPKVEIEAYYKKPVSYVISKEDSFIFFPILFLSLIGILVIVYSYCKLKQVPLLEMIKGANSLKLAKLRIMASRKFPGIVQIKNIFGATMIPFLSYLTFAYLKIKNVDKDRWFLLFIILFVSSAFAKLFTLAKIPIVVYLFSFLFLAVAINGRISKKAIMFSSLVFILLVILAYILIAGFGFNKDFLVLDRGPIARVAFVQIQGLFEHFDIFPNKIDFLGGASLPSYLANFFGKQHITSSRAVMEYLCPGAVKAGVAGVMNTHFIGEAWANWGYFGLFFSPIWVGAIIQIIFIILFRSPKNPINLALMTYFSVYLGMGITGGFVAYIYNVIVIFVLIIGILLKWLSYKSTALVRNN